MNYIYGKKQKYHVKKWQKVAIYIGIALFIAMYVLAVYRINADANEPVAKIKTEEGMIVNTEYVSVGANLYYFSTAHTDLVQGDMVEVTIDTNETWYEDDDTVIYVN